MCQKKLALVAEQFTPTHADGRIQLTPDFSVEFSELSNWTNSPSASGTPASLAVTVGGTFSIDDEVRITLRSTQESLQAFQISRAIKVVAGRTGVNEVAADLAAALEFSEENTPFDISVAGAVITIAHREAFKDFTYDLYTNSAAGDLTPVYTPVVQEVGTPEHLDACLIDEKAYDEATHDLVKMMYVPQVAQPFIDTEVNMPICLYLFLSAGEGANVITLLDGL